MIVFLAALGAGNRPIDAPPPGDRVSDWKLIGEANIKQLLTGVAYLSFSWSGLPSFFNIRAEMNEPKLYKRALTWSLSAVAIVYMTVAVTVYVLVGSHVSSPALGSAGPRFKIICYGIALIGLCVTTCLILHVRGLTHIFYASIQTNLFPPSTPQSTSTNALLPSQQDLERAPARQSPQLRSCATFQTHQPQHKSAETSSSGTAAPCP